LFAAGLIIHLHIDTYQKFVERNPKFLNSIVLF
jgi:hypothetical protein